MIFIIALIIILLYFNVGPPQEDIFLTAFYGLYFSHHYTYSEFLPYKRPQAGFKPGSFCGYNELRDCMLP